MMHATMHARLMAIATADNDREDRLGARCPVRLDLYLVGGHEAYNFALADGENSVDDKSIDLRHCDMSSEEVGACRIVAIDHIVMIAETWPTAAEEAAAAAQKVAA